MSGSVSLTISDGTTVCDGCHSAVYGATMMTLAGEQERGTFCLGCAPEFLIA